MSDFFIANSPEQNPKYGQNHIVVIGNFDGIHLGHQALFLRAQEWRQKLNLPAVVVTFEPHPLSVLRPPHERLFDLDDQQRQIQKSKIDGVVYYPFSRDFSQMPAADFLNKKLKIDLKPKVIVVGFNFHFGEGRKGDVELLQDWGRHHDCHVEVVQSVQNTNQKQVSTSEIRTALSRGEVEVARALLGRPYFISGVVLQGEARGRGLGFPTANIHIGHQKPIAFGVYATRVFVSSQKESLCSISHLGPLPTFSDQLIRLETHIFDFTQDLYGQKIQVEFWHRIRDVKKFSSMQELKEQIQIDSKLAKEKLGVN